RTVWLCVGFGRRGSWSGVFGDLYGSFYCVFGGVDNRDLVQTAILGARGFMAAVNSDRDARSVTPSQRFVDRVAISSRGGGRPPSESERHVSKTRRKRKGGLLDATLLAFAGIAILIGLGVWQLDRKVWKQNLITSINARLSRAPEDLPPRAGWSRLREDSEEFRRVAFPAEFLDGEEALVYTTGSPLRPDVKGPGYWVFSPARLAGGSIILV